MRKLWAMAVLLLLMPSSSRAEYFNVDYFGHVIGVDCEAVASGVSASGLAELAGKDMLEAKSCFAALATAAGENGLSGYSEVLFYTEFAQTVMPGYDDRALVSIHEAVKERKNAGRASRLALIYAMLSGGGFGAGIEMIGGEAVLLVRIDENIYGKYWGQDERYYVFEPGKAPEDPWIRELSGEYSSVVFHRGKAAALSFPVLAWDRTASGTSVSFKSPDGCPRDWEFQTDRLPHLERYLKLWPRDPAVMAANATKIFAPFGFAEKFLGSGLDESKAYDCMVRWVQLNAPYDHPHANEWRPSHVRRNPLETLFEFRSGICAELSIVLVGVLRSAGVSPDNIRLVLWQRDGEIRHMNVAVAASQTRGKGVSVSDGNRAYFVLDPAYASDKPELTDRWGLMGTGYTNPSIVGVEND